MSESDDAYGVEADFGTALNVAAQALWGTSVHAELAKAAHEGKLKLLIDYITSDRPLDKGERKELALFLSGVFARRNGRSFLRREERERRQAIYNDYKEFSQQFKAVGIRDHRNSAINQVIEKYKKLGHHYGYEQIDRFIRDPQSRE
jgi:hypothetical protein